MEMALFFIFWDALASMKDRQSDHLALLVADDHVVVGQLAVVGVDANVGSRARGNIVDCYSVETCVHLIPSTSAK